jgi:4'-phosphopantetheinyl transferase
VNWYKCNINEVKKEEYDTFFSLMSDKKKGRISRFKNDDDKKRSICAEMLAKREIAKRYGILPCNVILDAEENGKPYAKNLDIHFSLSHSGDYAVCALGEKPIGIDIQKIVPYNEKTAKKVCSQSELEIVEKSDDKSAEFIKLWTKKEAVMKMEGLGIGAVDIKNCLGGKKIETVRFLDYFISICEKAD